MAQKRYFEWIAGDDIGNVVALESIEEVEGEIVYTFDDGESVNQRYISPITDNILDLKEKVMVEVENLSNVWRLETIKPKIYKDESMQEGVEVPTLHDVVNAEGEGSMVNSNIGSTKLVPPAMKQRKRDLPRAADYKPADVAVSASPTKTDGVIKQLEQPPEPGVNDRWKERGSEEQPVAYSPEEKIDAQENVRKSSSFDPVVILVEKCKKHPTKISLELTIDLPAKSMYAIAESEFENGGQAFIDHVVDGINTKIIIEELKAALTAAYCSRKPDDYTDE